ncbi:hypothetical protein KP803_21210 [Vibrio sp. ZSDE26]|uniref:Uncharacterized protein n=1 Tax=Vibrio amylolyticus TaxID=2847292 RepID=A0A9X1XR66_9VIBR|nr:hypothetical protein [Vibrio amylolyticus]MCK6265783.1 hypothetical protein [Vibrio amylolyticus]
MNIKLGRVMTSSRLSCFVAFIGATFAWVLSMPTLLVYSVIFLLFSAALYLKDLWKNKAKLHAPN